MTDSSSLPLVAVNSDRQTASSKMFHSPKLEHVHVFADAGPRGWNRLPVRIRQPA